MAKRPRVLVSHSGRCSDISEEIAEALKKNGIELIDPLKFSAGVAIRAAVLKAAKYADALVVIGTSEDARLPVWAEHEVGLFNSQNKPIIVLVSDSIAASSFPDELKGNRWHSFDPKKPNSATRILAGDLMASA